MSLGLVLLFCHIATMIAAVAFSYGPGTVLFVAVRRRQYVLVRALIVAMAPFERLAPVLYTVGGLFGLATAIAFGFSILAPWLVIAYVLWVIATGTGITVHARYHQRLERLFEGTAEGPVTEEMERAIADPRERRAVALDYAVIGLLLFDMVVKPFS